LGGLVSDSRPTASRSCRLPRGAVPGLPMRPSVSAAHSSTEGW
jgi:hypothetical protein